MNRKTRIGTLASVACLASATVVCAQQPAPPPRPESPATLMAQGAAPEMGPPWGPIEILGFEAGGHGRKVVTGAPFSAIATSETVQTLADGNTIDRKSQTNLYRDSQGRFRKDSTIEGLGPLAASGGARTFVVISDPVAGKTYDLNPAEKVAHEIASGGPEGRRPGPGPIGSKLRMGKGPEGSVVTEDLGTQVIQGISAQGQRTTRTVPAGQIGNAKPIVITFESWYSPELQIVVMSKRSDPRFGTTTYTLTNIQRSEPDAALFTVPSGYSIQQGPRGMRKGGSSVPPPPPSE